MDIKEAQEYIVENMPEKPPAKKRKKRPMRPVNLRDFTLGMLATMVVVGVLGFFLIPTQRTPTVPTPVVATLLPTAPPMPTVISGGGMQPTVIARRLKNVSIAPDGRTFAVSGQNFEGASAEIRRMNVSGNLSSQRIAYIDPGFEVGKTVFNADGSRIATLQNTFASGTAVAHIYDAATGEQLTAFAASDLDFSRNGQWLASVTGTMLEIRDANTFEIVDSQAIDTTAYYVIFSADSSKVAITRDGQEAGFIIQTRDMQNLAQPIKEYAVQGRFVFDMSFHPNSNLLALATDQNVQVINLSDNGTRLWSVGDMRIFSVAFSPDGNWLAAGGGNTVGGASQIMLWAWNQTDILPPEDDWYTPRMLQGHIHDVMSLAFLPDGSYLLSAGRDGTVRLWDYINGQQKSELRM